MLKILHASAIFFTLHIIKYLKNTSLILMQRIINLPKHIKIIYFLIDK